MALDTSNKRARNEPVFLGVLSGILWVIAALGGIFTIGISDGGPHGSLGGFAVVSGAVTIMIGMAAFGCYRSAQASLRRLISKADNAG